MSIYLGTYCYLFLSVSVVQICKAFTPVVMMLSMVVCGMEKLDMAITLAMGLITLGTILTVTGGTIVVQWLGLASLGLSMVADTTKLILTQIMMKDQGLRLNVYESMYYLSPVSAVFVVVLIYFIELDQILESLPAIQDNYLPILASGILGIIVNVAGLLVIADENLGLAFLKPLSVFRNMLIVAVSQVFFGDSLTTQQMIAYAITTTGFVLFNVQQAKKRDLRLCVGNERPKQQ